MRSLFLSRSLFSLALSVATLLIVAAGNTHAADWSLSPSISVSETYDSNINFSFQNRESDFISSIKPRFLLTGQTEQDRFNLDSTVNGLIYIKNEQLNRVDTYNNAGWIRQWGPRFTSDIGGAFVKTTSLETQLQEAGIRTGLIDQYYYNLRAKGIYALSEILSLSLGGSAGQYWYPGNDSNLPDSNNALGNLTLAWKRSDANTFGIDTAYSYKHYIDYPTDSVQYIRPGLYWEHTFSETSSLLLGAGYRYTTIKYYVPYIEFVPPFQFIVAKRWFTTTNSSYDFWGTYKKRWTERLSSLLSVGRDQYSDVNGVTYNHMFVGTSANYGLTELTTVNCELRYDYNSGIEGGVRETNYFRVTPSIDRKLTQDLTLRLAGSYEYQLEDFGVSVGNDTANRFRAWLELVYQLPRLWDNK